MWTDKERGIAKQLLEPDVLAFIEKVFVKVSVAGGKDLKEVLKKNVVALSNEEYGQLMKVVFLTGEENKHRINLIKQAAQEPKKKDTTPTAPR